MCSGMADNAVAYCVTVVVLVGCLDVIDDPAVCNGDNEASRCVNVTDIDGTCVLIGCWGVSVVVVIRVVVTYVIVPDTVDTWVPPGCVCVDVLFTDITCVVVVPEEPAIPLVSSVCTGVVPVSTAATIVWVFFTDVTVVVGSSTGVTVTLFVVIPADVTVVVVKCTAVVDAYVPVCAGVRSDALDVLCVSVTSPCVVVFLASDDSTETCEVGVACEDVSEIWVSSDETGSVDTEADGLKVGCMAAVPASCDMTLPSNVLPESVVAGGCIVVVGCNVVGV